MNIYEETSKKLGSLKLNSHVWTRMKAIAEKVLESGCYKCKKGSKEYMSYCYDCGQILKDAEQRGLI